MAPKDVMLAWVDAFNRRDAEVLIPLYHPEATNHQVAAGEPAVGRETIIRDARVFFTAFPDSYTKLEAMHQGGEWVMIEWSGGATWLGGNSQGGSRTVRLSRSEGAGSSTSSTGRSGSSAGTGIARGGSFSSAFRSSDLEAR